MHNMTPHASFDNVSDVTRWSMDLRYTSASTPNNASEPPENYFLHPDRSVATMACGVLEADFVVRCVAAH